MVYTENADDDIAAEEDEDEIEEITNANDEPQQDEEEEPFHGFDPQIVSVKSISNNNNIDHLNNDSNSQGASANTMSNDIFDSLCELNDENDEQNDLADIQIEPNIIDFESTSHLTSKASQSNVESDKDKTPATIVITEEDNETEKQPQQHSSHIPIIPAPGAPKSNTSSSIQTKRKQVQDSQVDQGANVTTQLSLKPITELVDPKPADPVPKTHQNLVISSPMTVQQPPISQPEPPPPSTELTCSFCNKKFSLQTDLISHLTSSGHINAKIDPTPENIADGYLSYTTTTTVNWNKDNPQITKKIRSMCLSCGKTFGKVEQVKIHLNVHYGDNIYTCRFCEKVFTNFTVFDVSKLVGSYIISNIN